MAARFRSSCLSLGVVSVAGGVLVGFGISIGGVLLPGRSGAMLVSTVATGVSLGLFVLVSGVTMTLARGWVTTLPQGHLLDRRKSALALYPLGVPAGAGLFASSIFYVTFTARFTWSAEEVTRTVHLVTPGIAAYLFLPAIAVVLCMVNLVVGWPLFRPSQRTIQRYAR
ncbi:Uncharacterised protein [Amycolatopsis camponoti]|uniref:Uncharacterized protein n=1 Tax=Amycolatopsis camponoti TaxID=2606593 RepID=A0A6I8M3N2_9PSEU|nr:hypothetical protein [Amycolatopsis camponoti]VVJ24414.1 Uncharacterised protein [Amycolatopsis camponoti]